MYKFIDLFCGIGGFRVALEKHGMKCVFSCDIDKNVQSIYKQNFGEKPKGDLTEIHEKEIPKHDILCAGFPCQSFSISGKMQGISDSRGRLFYDIVRVAKYHRPYILLLENVKNIISIDDGKVLKTIETKLNEIGYIVHKHVLNASHFGIPQARERVYFACLRNDFKMTYKEPKPSLKKIYLEDILEKNVDKSLYIDRDDIAMNGKENIKNDLKPIRLGIVNKGGQGERIYSTKGHAITLSAFGGGVGARTGLYYTDQGVRKLSINECKVLMGLSTKHIVSDGAKGYQQLGNSVIPAIIENVWENIRVN